MGAALRAQHPQTLWYDCQVRTASGAEQAATKGMGFSHGGKVNEESFKMITYTKVTWGNEVSMHHWLPLFTSICSFGVAM